MSATSADIVARIEELQRARGISQRTLADLAGLSTTQLSRIMNAQRKLTATELGLLADALQVPASQLLGESEHRRNFAARVGRAERAAELDGSFRRAEDLLATRELLDRVAARPEADPAPEIRRVTAYRHIDQGRQAANHLRRALGLVLEAVEDLDELAGRFGLDVSVQPLPKNLHGLLVAADAAASEAQGLPATAVALLNGDDTVGRRRFTLAHELGHLIFNDAQLAIADYAKRAGRDSATVDSRWTPERLVELRADYFAAHLLAPDDGVRAVAADLGVPGEDRERWTTRLVVEVALRYGISLESASYRSNDVGLLSKTEGRRVCARGAHQAFVEAGRSEERASVLDVATEVLPPYALVSQALSAYQSEVLGLKPLATLYDARTPEDVAALRGQLHQAGWAPRGAAVS